ncbi:bacterial NAD-glutamate dehydrogenase family protein, partial [Vibrio parahaemolyticus VP2007-007]
GNNVS